MIFTSAGYDRRLLPARSAPAYEHQCSMCEKVCPYGAIHYEDKEYRMPDRTTKVRRVSVVNEAVCQGCGACTVACMSGAMDLRGFMNRQIMAEVDAICK